jgi:hypothetical protein
MQACILFIGIRTLLDSAGMYACACTYVVHVFAWQTDVMHVLSFLPAPAPAPAPPATTGSMHTDDNKKEISCSHRSSSPHEAADVPSINPVTKSSPDCPGHTCIDP